jgi:hypothetical protein
VPPILGRLGTRVAVALPVPELRGIGAGRAGLHRRPVHTPFVVPFFDRMAKRDLAAHRREVEAEAPVDPGHE